jgi:hypothetical protein
MKTCAAAVLAFLVFPVASARANDWHAGPGIALVSQINDVLDIYKQNLAAQGKSVDVKNALPIGVAFDVHYQWDTGLRIGAGVGPYFRLNGDAKHFELPINGTVGYTFIPEKVTSPYLKGGFVSHVASGDFYSKSDPGFLAAGGVEFARRKTFNYTIELSVDQSKIELNTVCGQTAGCTPGTVKLHSYQTVLSFFLKF